MARKVVGIVGSPRKGKNTDTLVREALEGARSAGAETETIHLNDLDIRPCQACPRSPAPEPCFFEDGMAAVYRALATAAALVVGSPIYYDSVSAQLKLAIDRSNCLAERATLAHGRVVFRSRLSKRKKALLILLADSSRDFGPALATVRLWCKDANIDLDEILTVTDADRGEGARKREDLLERAFEMGAALARAVGAGTPGAAGRR